MRNSVRQSLLLCTLPLMLATAHAQVLTFEGSTTGVNRQLDGIGATATGPSLIDYAGYDWVGMQVNKPLVVVNRPGLITAVTTEEDEGEIVNVYTTTPVDTGFHRSAVSGDTVAYIQPFSGSTFGSISARQGQVNFNLFSSYLTAGYRDNIDVSVTGLRGGEIVYNLNLVVGDDGPVLTNFNFLNIDKVEFRTSGGTFLYPNGTTVGTYSNPSGAFSSPLLVLDNLSIAAVPEPGTWAMLLVGMGLVGAAARRRSIRT
jgi:PEP-CTERM motif